MSEKIDRAFTLLVKTRNDLPIYSGGSGVKYEVMRNFWSEKKAKTWATEHIEMGEEYILVETLSRVNCIYPDPIIEIVEVKK